MSDRRIRIGIDVGGTFTKAIALDIVTGEILSSSTVPTTHTAERGVSAGIVTVLSNLLKESEIRLNEIEIIAHSTTQAINALLESDTAKVGIVAMGVGPEKSDIIKRTNLSDTKINYDNDVAYGAWWDNAGHGLTHWQVNWDEGGSEGGSSGSPIFNERLQIVGVLTGGAGECDEGWPDYYGCLLYTSDAADE